VHNSKVSPVSCHADGKLMRLYLPLVIRPYHVCLLELTKDSSSYIGVTCCSLCPSHL
jgi:hypothetical protein